jgi:hypothetical protein
MRKTESLLLGACLLATAWTAASCGGRTRAEAAPQGAARAQTITGQIVCLVCYARNHTNTGADHDDGRMCAQACIKWEGNPAGILAADGKVYQLSGGVVENNNARVLPYIARKVTVAGDVYDKDGMMMIRADAIQPAP